MDADGNIAEDTGNPLSGWEIRAYADLNSNGILDQADYDNGIIDSDTTNASGYYELTLDPGDYIVVEVLQSTWYQSAPGTDVVGTVTTGGEVLGQYGYAISLDSGDSDTLNNFGNYLLGSIHGFKFEDIDANGLYDGTDTPMADVTIFIDENANGVLDWTDAGGMNGVWDEGEGERWTLTDSNGKFHFEDLLPGTYTVVEGFTDGTTWMATVDHDTPPDGIGDNTTTVTVQSGEELVAFEGDANLGAEDPQHEVVVDYDLIFGNHEVGGIGLTPGFWANHLYVWDGIEDNGPQDGQGRYLADKLADDDVISAPEILDSYHEDLVFDGRLTIQWADAQEIVSQSNKKGGDKLYDFVRYAITTWLNVEGVPGFSAPVGLMEDIADWLLEYGPTSSGVLQYQNSSEGGGGFAPNAKIKANSVAWQIGNGTTIPAGMDIFATMTSLTDDASMMMITSLDGSQVFLAVNNGSYLGLVTGTLNDEDGYLNLL